MAEFSDFLGHILEEITRARVMADLEAIKTAKMYAADTEGLLKLFPVPRMRLPNIEITAPVIITDVPEGYVEKTDPALLSQSVAHDLVKALAREKIKITITDIVKIIKEDAGLSKGYINDTSADVLSAKIANRFSPIDGRSKSSADVHKQVVALIHSELIKTFQLLPRKATGIAINATTAAIKEFNPTAGQGANVVYFKMTITEDAMEIEMNNPTDPASGNQSSIKRLLPE